MESQLLWFLLAGFILGFATSTLWEWLYFRGLRLNAIEGILQQNERLNEVPLPYESARATPHTPTEAHYRSPAVFLEGEQSRDEGQSSSEPASYEPLQVAVPEPVKSPAETEAEQTSATTNKAQDSNS